MSNYLGIEIGGTKLQVGVGPDDGKLRALWRGDVDVAAGPEGIRRQIVAAVPKVLQRAKLDRGDVRGVGIGFGGPVDDATRTVIKSHQIKGWDGFPLADWVGDTLELPAVLGNDSDVAGLAEALHGAGKGLSPLFYFNIGSGIGGALILDGEIYRGVGRGAVEFGHLKVRYFDVHNIEQWEILEKVASGWGIAERARRALRGEIGTRITPSVLREIPARKLTAHHVFEAQRTGNDHLANWLLQNTWDALVEALCHVVTLLCPRRIVVGGGVAGVGDELLFRPLRERLRERVFAPFAGLTDIVPAALGEEVVVHGAIALARKASP
jgi:glucokinase